MRKGLIPLILALLLLCCCRCALADVITDGKMVANIEKIETYGGTLHIVGWVYDKEISGKSITIHINNTYGYTANVYRADVNKAYGISGSHGFDIEHAWNGAGGDLRVQALYGIRAGDLMLINQFMDPVYTVTYNANGGSGAPKADPKHNNIPLHLSNTVPTRTGYTFKGWATSSTGSVAYKAGASYTSNSSRTLYAVWEKDTYTLSFDANGGESAPAAMTAQYNTATTLPSDVPTREGYDFAGWATSAASSAAYQPGASVTVTKNLTLYAVWQKKTYAVAFDANGGENAPASQTKTHGENLTLPSAVPSRAEYIFLGWAADPAAETPDLQPGGVYAANAPITLYAVWEPDRLPGDVSGDKAVTPDDTSLLLAYLAGNDVSIVTRNANVNGDGVIDGRDALRLMKYLDGQGAVLE